MQTSLGNSVGWGSEGSSGAERGETDKAGAREKYGQQAVFRALFQEQGRLGESGGQAVEGEYGLPANIIILELTKP